jgi:hypothetical protein
VHGRRWPARRWTRQDQHQVSYYRGAPDRDRNRGGAYASMLIALTLRESR